MWAKSVKVEQDLVYRIVSRKQRERCRKVSDDTRDNRLSNLDQLHDKGASTVVQASFAVIGR